MLPDTVAQRLNSLVLRGPQGTNPIGTDDTSVLQHLCRVRIHVAHYCTCSEDEPGQDEQLTEQQQQDSYSQLRHSHTMSGKT